MKPLLVFIIIVVLAAVFTLAAALAFAENPHDARGMIALAHSMLPKDFDTRDADAQRAAVDNLSADDRSKVISLLHTAYTQASFSTTTYPLAGQALMLLQEVDPTQRLQCLRDLNTLLEKLYSANRAKNVGYGKCLAAAQSAIAQELWKNLAQDEQAGRITSAPQMRKRLFEILAAYQQSQDICRDLIATVEPYSRGKKPLADFVSETKSLRESVLTERKSIDDALRLVNNSNWRPTRPAAPVPASQPVLAATTKPAVETAVSTPAPAETEPTTLPVVAATKPAPPPAEETHATVPPPPPADKNKNASHDLFDFGREGL